MVKIVIHTESGSRETGNEAVTVPNVNVKISVFFFLSSYLRCTIIMLLNYLKAKTVNMLDF